MGNYDIVSSVSQQNTVRLVGDRSPCVLRIRCKKDIVIIVCFKFCNKVVL